MFRNDRLIFVDLWQFNNVEQTTLSKLENYKYLLSAKDEPLAILDSSPAKILVNVIDYIVITNVKNFFSIIYPKNDLSLLYVKSSNPLIEANNNIYLAGELVFIIYRPLDVTKPVPVTIGNYLLINRYGQEIDTGTGYIVTKNNYVLSDGSGSIINNEYVPNKTINRTKAAMATIE